MIIEWLLIKLSVNWVLIERWLGCCLFINWGVDWGEWLRVLIISVYDFLSEIDERRSSWEGCVGEYY